MPLRSLPAGLSPDAVPPLLRTIAAQDLPTSGIDSFPRQSLDDDAWEVLTRMVSRHRIWSLLARAIASGRFPATDAQAAEAFERDEAAVLASMHLDQTLMEVGTSLRSSGLDARVFKGAAFAQLFYSDPGQRTYSDVDLLVRSEQFDPTSDALLNGGAIRHNPDSRPGFTAKYGKSAAFTLPGGWEIDLHRSPQEGPFGAAVRTEDLFDDPTTFTIAGQEVKAISLPALLLVACYHAILPSDERRLQPLRDVAQILVCGNVDAQKVQELAKRWRGELVVATAVETAVEYFDLPHSTPLFDWARRYKESKRERRWINAYHDLRPRSDLTLTIYTVLAFPSPIAGIRFLYAQVFHDSRDPFRVRAGNVLKALRQKRP